MVIGVVLMTGDVNVINRDVIIDLLEKHPVKHDGDIAKTEHLICPTCDGGKGREKSFVIYYTPLTTYYKCYRGTCPERGRIYNQGEQRLVQGAERDVKPKNIYNGDFTKLKRRERDWVQGKYLTTGLRAHLHKNSKCGRLVVTLRDEWMVPWGVELKNWCNIKHLPKSSRKYLRYDMTGNNLAWAVEYEKSNKFKTLFVTEDVISAYRIQEDTGRDAVALLGTNLRPEDAAKILRQGYERLALVLDPDQAGLDGMLKLAREYGFMFDISSHVLAKDPKNLTKTQLEKAVKSVNYI